MIKESKAQIFLLRTLDFKRFGVLFQSLHMMELQITLESDSTP